MVLGHACVEVGCVEYMAMRRQRCFVLITQACTMGFGNLICLEMIHDAG